jgi:hypothetical protein
MHTVQSSKGRHNIFSDIDHDRKHIETASNKKKKADAQNATVLPEIDLNVRQKLAATDLLVKFGNKSKVLTVASTLAKDKSTKDVHGDTLGMDIDDDMASTKSQNSVALDKVKHQLTITNNNDSPLTSPGRLVPLSPNLSTTYLENDQEGDPLQNIDEYDDDDQGNFGSQLNEQEYSRTDAKRYKTALEAHHSFMSESKSKNNMKYIKNIGSEKVLPSLEMIEDTKKARSILEAGNSPSKKSSSASPAKSSNLKPLTTSFMFLTAITKGKVPKLAGVSSPSSPATTTSPAGAATSLALLSPQNRQNDFDNDSVASPDGQSLAGKSLKSQFNSSFLSTGEHGDDANNNFSPADKHFVAPLQGMDSSLIKPALSTKTFSRFGGNGSSSASPVSALRQIKSFDPRSSPQNNNNLQDHAEEKSEYNDAENDRGIFGKIKKIFESPDPNKRHAYDMPDLNSLQQEKRAFLKGFDNAVTNLTYMEAPQRPKTPPPKKPDALTMKNVFGDGELIEANIPHHEQIDDDAYHKLVFGSGLVPRRETYETVMPYQQPSSSSSSPEKQLNESGKGSQRDQFQQQPSLTMENLMRKQSSHNTSKSKSSSSAKLLIEAHENNAKNSHKLTADVLPFHSSSSFHEQQQQPPHSQQTPQGQHPDAIPENDPVLSVESSKLYGPPSVKESDKFVFQHSPYTRQSSTASDFSYATMTSSKDPFSPGFKVFEPDSRLPPLDFTALNSPSRAINSNQNQHPFAQQNNIANANSIMATNLQYQVNPNEPPQRRRSFLNLPAIAQNSYGAIRASFLGKPNFNKKYNLSSDSTESTNNTTGAGGLHDYTKALSMGTQNFLSNIVKQFSKSTDSHNPAMASSYLTNNNKSKSKSGDPNDNEGMMDRPIFPSEDFYNPNYYLPVDPDNANDNPALLSPKQPLSETNEDFIYQHSTNSYVPKDFINQSSFGFHHRSDGSAHHQRDNYFSERHLDQIEQNTAGNSEPVIFLPPNFQQHQYKDEETEQRLSKILNEEEDGGDDNSSLHSHNILKVYSRKSSKPILSPGIVVAENNFPKAQQFIHSPEKSNPHYVHYSALYGKKAPEDIFELDDNDNSNEDVIKETWEKREMEFRQQSFGAHKKHSEETLSPSHIAFNSSFHSSPPAHSQHNNHQHHHHQTPQQHSNSPSRHNSNHHIHFDPHINVISPDARVLETKNNNNNQQQQQMNPDLSPQLSKKSSLKISTSNSRQSSFYSQKSLEETTNANKKILVPVSSNLDLRDEILEFMKKTNSPLKDDYENHVDKTQMKPTQSIKSPARATNHPSHQEYSPLDSRRSDMSSTHDEAQRKLWDKLQNRYAGDREGEYHMKIKIKNYLKDSVKEETQIMQKYMEEIEDWK